MDCTVFRGAWEFFRALVGGSGLMLPKFFGGSGAVQVNLVRPTHQLQFRAMVRTVPLENRTPFRVNRGKSMPEVAGRVEAPLWQK
jgi:hypothetical protein